jgi:TP901 family phage tail tape measure protein
MRIGNLEVGIIVSDKEFRAQLNALVQSLETTQRRLSGIVVGTAKQTSKVVQELDKTLMGQTRSQKIQLQQQYYQTASLQRLAFIVAGLTATMTYFGKAAVQSFMNFEQKMADARAAAQATDVQFAKMTELALEMGRTTIFSAQESAVAMELLAKAGYQATDVMKAFDGAMLLAGATGESLESGVTLLVNVLNQFKIATDKSTDAANILAGGAQFSLATIQNLGQGLKFVGSTAHQFGMSLEETVTALAALTNAGIRMQMAGRLLSSGLLTLNANNSAVQKGLYQLGIKFNEVAPATHNLTQIVARFEKSQIALGDAQKFSAGMTTLFGKESARVMLALVSLGEKGYGELLKRIEQTGNAEAMMIMRTDTLQYALKELANVVQNLMIGMGKVAGTGGLKGFVLGLTELLRAIERGNQGLTAFVGNMTPYIIGAGMALTATVGLTYGVFGLCLALNELQKNTIIASSLLGRFFTTLPGWGVLATAISVASVFLIKNVQAMGITVENTAKQFKKANLEFEISKYQTESLITNWKNLNKELLGLIPGTEDYIEKKKQQLNVISQLIELYPELLGVIDREGVKIDEVEKIIDSQIKKRKEQVKVIRDKTIKAYEDEIKIMDKLIERGEALSVIFETWGEKAAIGHLKAIKKILDLLTLPTREPKKLLTLPVEILYEIFGIDKEKVKAKLEEEKKKLDEIARGVFKDMKGIEVPATPIKPFDWSNASDKAKDIYGDLMSQINKLTMDRYSFEQAEEDKRFRELNARIDAEVSVEEGGNVLKDKNKEAHRLISTHIGEERLEDVKKLLDKEKFEAEKAGLEGIALKRKQIEQEFEDQVTIWDKRYKEGEVDEMEYSQAIINISRTRALGLRKIDKDTMEIYKKAQDEIVDYESKMAIGRAVGREKELLEIEDSRRRELRDLEDKREKQLRELGDDIEKKLAFEEQYQRMKKDIQDNYDSQRKEVLSKLGELDEMILSKVIDSMMDLVTVTKDWGEYFKKTMQQLLMDLTKMFLKILLAKTAMDIFKSSATTIGGIFGIPVGILSAFKSPAPAMAMPTMMPSPALAGMPPLPPPTAMLRPSVIYRITNNTPIYITGDVVDWDGTVRRKIKPAMRRIDRKRFE